MNVQNTLIRAMIKGAIITIMIFSIPIKVFNTFFQWREEKQSKLLRKNSTKDIRVKPR